MFSSLVFVTDKRGGRMMWEENLGYGNNYNRSGRWGVQECGGGIGDISGPDPGSEARIPPVAADVIGRR